LFTGELLGDLSKFYSFGAAPAKNLPRQLISKLMGTSGTRFLSGALGSFFSLCVRHICRDRHPTSLLFDRYV